MGLANMKELAEKFRAVADDRAAVVRLCDETCRQNPDDQNCTDVCRRFRDGTTGDSVRVICDEIKNRKA